MVKRAAARGDEGMAEGACLPVTTLGVQGRCKGLCKQEKEEGDRQLDAPFVSSARQCLCTAVIVVDRCCPGIDCDPRVLHFVTRSNSHAEFGGPHRCAPRPGHRSQRAGAPVLRARPRFGLRFAHLIKG